MGTYIEKLASQHHVTKVDATEPLIVEVTERDIRLAKQKNAKQCALARAVKRSIPGAKSAHFFRTTAFVEFKDKIVRYQLPGSIQKEIVSFDRAKVMSAGAYRLSPVGPVRAGRGSKKSKKHQKPARTTATRIKARHQLQDVRTKFEPEG